MLSALEQVRAVVTQSEAETEEITQICCSIGKVSRAAYKKQREEVVLLLRKAPAAYKRAGAFWCDRSRGKHITSGVVILLDLIFQCFNFHFKSLNLG